jgi:hypothetical protein
MQQKTQMQDKTNTNNTKTEHQAGKTKTIWQ